LPLKEGLPALLFDWELAGVGLPQSDLINICYGRDEFDLEKTMPLYLDKMAARGVYFDRSRFLASMSYARLQGSFYVLWLLHLKLMADPEGDLPCWMRTISEGLLKGDILNQAEEAWEYSR